MNISSLNLGRTEDNASAVMVVNIDSSVDDAILKQIEEINGIALAKYVRLKGKI